MTEKHDVSGILQDLAVLYELSLMVGSSLDLNENCDAFLRTLMARKNLDYAAVWIRSRFTHEGDSDDSDGYSLCFAVPGLRAKQKSLPANHPMFTGLKNQDAYSVSFGETGFEALIAEQGINQGTMVLYRLGEFGVLKLFTSARSKPFGEVELSKLRHVVEKFSVSVAGCIDHARVRSAEQSRRDIEAQMLHAQKLESLGMLAGGVAHDFNNLLTAILGNAELARPGLHGRPEGEQLDNIIGASARAAELCSQLLAYSGGGRFVNGPVHLNDVIEEMMRLTSVTISKKARLAQTLDPSIPSIEGDATQIRQVFMNLVTNASEALGEEAGDLSITTGVSRLEESELEEFLLGDQRKPGNYVFVEVMDTGCGMEPGTQQRLFDPFYTTKFTGRGLGLAAVMGIVHSHRGAVRVRSHLGRGTRVRVVFPTSSKAALDHTPKVAPIEDLPKEGLVLVADDEGPVRELIAQILERFGLQVLKAKDGGEAMSLFESFQSQIDLVILDLTMPVLSGDQIFRQMKALDPNVRVILMSGYSEVRVNTRFEDGGPMAFLEKPFRVDEVKRLVSRVLGGEVVVGPRRKP